MRKIASAIGAAALLLLAGASAAQALDASQIPGLQAVAPGAGILIFDSGDQLKLPGEILEVDLEGNDLVVEYRSDDDEGGFTESTRIDLSAWS